jgi:hypothetical protein
MACRTAQRASATIVPSRTLCPSASQARTHPSRAHIAIVGRSRLAQREPFPINNRWQTKLIDTAREFRVPLAPVGPAVGFSG